MPVFRAPKASRVGGREKRSVHSIVARNLMALVAQDLRNPHGAHGSPFPLHDVDNQILHRGSARSIESDNHPREYFQTANLGTPVLNFLIGCDRRDFLLLEDLFRQHHFFPEILRIANVDRQFFAFLAHLGKEPSTILGLKPHR
jgi:hypothetical protein